MSEPTAARSSAPPPRLSPLMKLVLELGPLGVFFLSNSRPKLFEPLFRPFLSEELFADGRGAIFVATAAFMLAMMASLAVTWWLARRLPIMPLVSGAVVVVFGALTLALHDELFIKLKPTIVNGLFATVLLGGLAFGRPLLPYVLDSVVALNPQGWWKLTLRWGVFFIFLAILNEAVWRTQTTDFWVAFKVFGVMPLTMGFALLQLPLILRHQIPEEPEPHI